jgi:predicted permease
MNWLRRLFSQARLERELDAEMRFHFEQAVEDAMRSGVSEAEARRAARLQWGGAEQLKEECRDERAAAWLTGTLADARVAWRGLRKSPVFAVAAIVALALGIGGNTAIFSVVNAAFLRPLPFPNADRLVFAREQGPRGGTGRVPPPEILAWSRTGVLESWAGDEEGAPATDITAPGHAPEPLHYTRVTTNFLSTLGVAPQLGRDFYPDECEQPRSRVALLSDQFWRNSFGASPAALGATVAVDTQSYTVVGVLPPGFAFPGGDRPDVISPSRTCLAGMATQRGGWLSVIGRLRPGISVRQAQARLEVATRQLSVAQPDVFEYLALRNPRAPWVSVMTLKERFSANYRTLLALMMGVAACMLLIVCANVANLFLARAMAREREVAVRAALGASRLRLLRLLLIESLMLSLAGGALGVGLAYLVAPALRFLLPQAIPLGTPLDWRVLAFTAASTVGAALIVGIAPALAASRVDLGAAMKDGGAPTAARAGRGLLRSSLAIAQLALSLALLAGAGLLLRSFVNLVRVDMGFDPQNVIAVELNLPGKGYDAASRVERFRAALAAASAGPGVESVGMADAPPVTRRPSAGASWRTETGHFAFKNFWYLAASAGYFGAMRIPLLAGRGFDEGDDKSARQVVILNQSAARELFGDANPLGERITLAAATDKPFWLTVVGVVGDVRRFSYDAKPDPEVYFSLSQTGWPGMSIVARSRIDPAVLAPALRRAVQMVNPDKKVPVVKRPDEMLSDSVAQRRQRAYLLGAFAALSLLVAMVGVYGVVAYSVARRTHEIGVRMALGAQPRDVLRMVLGEGLKLALAGAAIGLALTLWLSRALASFLFGVGPRDAVTFVAASVILTAAVCLASYLPSRQATRVDPATALRRE